MNRLATAVVLLGLLAAVPMPALAQFPSKPVRIVVPFPSGGGVDAGGRILAQRLSQTLGQPVLVENKPGADGAIAAEYVAKAAPDGYTLGYLGSSALLAVPLLRRNPPYDSVHDFTPISLVGRFGLFLVTNSGVPAGTLAELIAFARANPAKLNVAITTTTATLVTAQLMSLAGLEMVPVAYKGEMLAVPDLLSGRVQLMFGSGNVLPLVKDGKLRAIVSLQTSRNRRLPDLPTWAEANMPSLTIGPWTALFGPAKMPKDLVERLSRDVNSVLERPDVKEQHEKLEIEIHGSSPDELAGFIRAQFVDWKRAAQEAGIQPQ